MAVMNGVQETCYQQFFGTSSTGYFVDQINGATNEENNLHIEVPHSEAPNSSVLDLAGKSKNDEKLNFANTEHEEKAKCRTSEIADCELNMNSPSERESHSPSHSRGRSHRRSRSPSGSSSSNSRSRSRSYYSRSRSSNRSASHSRRYKRYRRSSRSSSRSSRSLSPRYRRHSPNRCRRYHRSPRRYRSRSRSRSHVRVYYGRYRSRSRSRSRSRGRRYYGFVRRAYPATFRSWRSRSRTRSRSRSRSPLHLTEKDRLKLLEIAKANAAKALGKSVDLPPSLKKDSWLSDTLHRSFEADSGKLSKQPRNSNNRLPSDVSPQQGEHLFICDSTVVQPVHDKRGNNLVWPQQKEEAKKAKGQWVPIQ